jgi:CDP-diacylglycerol--serine O-phosphatidyltransferase
MAMQSDGNPKIYLLPNLMTAGNLFCGFAATRAIMEGALLQAQQLPAFIQFHEAIWFILGACIFDMLDGRLARLGGHESPFGREFDSIADIISFGIAPALLIYRIVLRESPNYGWLVAFVYLVCGALRLARFNCIAAASGDGAGKDFKGFPIPAAAGVIASITLFLLRMQRGEHEIGPWRYVLPGLMLFLSFMMFSGFRYPSFKGLNWRTQKSIPRFLAICILVVFTAVNYEWMPAILFIAYLAYGFLRPWLSLKWRREIEEELGEEEAPEEVPDELPPDAPPEPRR